MFRYDKFPGFGTPLIFFLECSPNKLFIQITLSRNARIQMDLSKNNRFSQEEATNYVPRIEKRKKVQASKTHESSGSLCSPKFPILSWKLKIIASRGSSTIPPSFKLELLCQYEMTSWHYIVTDSSIIDDLGVRDPLLVCLFPVQTLPKRLNFSKVNIYMFKDKKKSSRTRCKICPTYN